MTSVNKNRKFRDENAMAKYNDKELAETSKFLSFVANFFTSFHRFFIKQKAGLPAF